jgi:SAM-dependent methyltransferase
VDTSGDDGEQEPSAGYLADIGYTAGFYRAMAPNHLAFAALSVGRSPGRAGQPRRVLELGFGQGFGLALLAAANPDVAFEGCDLNPGHVANARALASAAGLANVSFSQASFEEAAVRGGDADVDVVALHGILSWVSRPAQDAILAIIRQRLRPGGLLYVSYNCLPGWAPLAPIRALMREVACRTPGGSERQLARALDAVAELRRRNAVYFAANPAAARHLDGMLGMDPRYLAHEYLDEDWQPLPFGEVAARLGEAGLDYVGSATLAENLDQCAVPAATVPLLAQTEDPVLRETLRDFAANKQFRRDVFARGAKDFAGAEPHLTLTQLGFALAVPRSRASFQFAGPLCELTGRGDLYGPIADALADGIAGYRELAELPPFRQRSGLLLECLALLVHSGQVLPVLPSGPVDPGPAQRFNRLVVERARAGEIHDSLASPVTRTGIPVTDFGLLALAALFDGKAAEPGSAAEHALAILKALGRRPGENGRPLEDDGEAAAFLAGHMAPILEESVPLWRRLGVL